MKRTWIVLTLSLCAHFVCAQNSPEIDLDRLTDDLLAGSGNDINYENAFETLAQVLTSPLDLNTVTDEELLQLNVLTDQEVEDLLTYRREYGPLIDIYELQAIPGFTSTTISRLLPFVTVVDPATRINRSLLRRMFSAGNSYLVMRYERTLEAKKGFKAISGNGASYAGSPDKLYFRIRSSLPGDFSFGLTGEKDPGEKITFDGSGHQAGFDFMSYHVQLRNKGKLKNLIAGDFQCQFGQGLILGGAFGLGKGGANVASLRKSNIGFQPYTSVQENAYHRGVAVSYAPVHSITVSAYYSLTFRDASLETDTNSVVTTSFQTTGYHRTATELGSRKKVTEQNAGLIVAFQRDRLDAGVIVNAIHFDIPVLRTSTLYNQFEFRGSRNLNTGIFVNYRLNNISFFSETARSASGGSGTLAGLLMSVHSQLELAILYRSYGRNFHSLYGNAFSENTELRNERGVYWGWQYRWNRKYSVYGFADLFAFPWLGFRRYAPSHGYEWMLRGVYEPSRNAALVFSFREESKPRNRSGTQQVYTLEPLNRHVVSAHCDYGIRGNIRLKSRVQYSMQNSGTGVTEGWAVVQDVSISLGKFQITARHGLFDTDQSDNRQYVYERDAWSSYSLPAYSGVGVRNYALIEYNLSKRVTIWLRYARTRMSSVAEIGSGQDTIEGNTKNDVKFQARLKF